MVATEVLRELITAEAVGGHERRRTAALSQHRSWCVRARLRPAHTFGIAALVELRPLDVKVRA